MKILILGAAGEISKILTDRLLKNKNNELVLFARNANRRLSFTNNSNVEVIDGDFSETEKLTKIMNIGIDIVYINAMDNLINVKSVITAMKNSGVSKLICASVLGIYDEVKGAFGEWNKRMVGDATRYKQVAEAVEESGLNYTIMRLTWLYNQTGNTDYVLTQKGENFYGAQVTRQAVAKLIEDIIEDKTGEFDGASIGVGEPNTDFAKPSFY